MTRLAIILAAVAALMAGAFYAGKQWDAAKDATATNETIERVEDALSNPDGLSWSCRLFGTCD